jgi:hypothetical protein
MKILKMKIGMGRKKRMARKNDIQRSSGMRTLSLTNDARLGFLSFGFE